MKTRLILLGMKAAKAALEDHVQRSFDYQFHLGEFHGRDGAKEAWDDARHSNKSFLLPSVSSAMKLTRLFVLAQLLVLLTGCYGIGDYNQARNPTHRFIDPTDYRVDSSLYPKYRATKDFSPPDLLPNPHNEPHLRMPRISTDYVWQVRHRVDDQFWLYSEEYARRGGSNLEIAITADGRVLHGWRGIANALLKGDRIISITPDRYDLEWGNERLFEAIKPE